MERESGGEGKNTIRIRKTGNEIEPKSSSAENSSLMLMTISEAAVFLNLKISMLRSLVFRKEIPFLKFGRLVRFRAQDLEEWVLARRSTQPGFSRDSRDTSSRSIFEIDTRFNKANSKGLP